MVREGGSSPEPAAGRDGTVSTGNGGGVGDADDEALHWLARALAERVKELNCLYGISALVDASDSLEDVLQGVVELLPASWQYPEVTCARIRLRRKQFQTVGFKETEWKQAETIMVKGKPVGTVEVCYLVEKPGRDEGPFLTEERHLIRAVAERLGKIIDRERAEQRLRALYRREKHLRGGLQAEMRRRVDLTRHLVHELKTPLTSLLATSQLLRDETQDERLRRLAGYVWESARGLDSRVSELHDLAKGELGMLEVEIEPFNLEDLLRSVVGETKALADQSNVAVALDVATPLPPVHGDLTRVRQVVLNLLGNAFRFASGSGTVTIRAFSKGHEVTVEVKDQGPGISKRQQKHLFKPYHALLHRGKHTGGLGIGLSLCRMLAELQGGRIWVSSGSGKGASFFFTLPIVAPGEEEAEEVTGNDESAGN